jgi:formylglycine-generating enzyme required for sulfatase activity
VFCNKLSMQEGLSPAYRIYGATNPDRWGNAPTILNASWEAVEIVAGSNGYRLPTEAQWEYACRAGTTTPYNTGATINDNTGWYDSNSGGRTHAAGLKPPNAWGLYDMHGNVNEWCWDLYGPYTDTYTDPTGAVSNLNCSRVVRGGSWGGDSLSLRSAQRGSSYPNLIPSNSIGFRVSRP